METKTTSGAGAAMSDELAKRIASLSPEKRAVLEQRLMKKKAATPDEDSIPRRNPEAPCYLSFCQQRLWFLDQLTPGTSTYNVPNAMQVSGPLNLDALRQALSDIIRRHEVLRTKFVTQKGLPLQVVAQKWESPLQYIDLRSVPGREAEARRLLQEEARRCFNLTKDLMIRAMVVQIEEQEYLLLISTHHVGWDAWSKTVAYRELAHIYRAIISNTSVSLPGLPIQYADFAQWQRNWLRSEGYQREVAYWKQHLDSAARFLNVRTDRKRPAAQTFRGAKFFFSLPQSLAEMAKAFSKQQGVTLYMTLLATFYAFLYAITGQEDISVGSPVAGRNHPELERLIGFFINTLVMRTEVSAKLSFRELVHRVRETTLGAFAHQELPFEKLVEIIQPPRDLSRMALFQVNFRVAGAAPPQLELQGIKTTPLELIDTATSKFDLALELAPNTEEASSYVEYNSDLFEESTIARMCGDYQRVLSDLLSQPEVSLESLGAVGEILRRSAMETVNREKPKMKSLKDIKRKAVDLSKVDMIKTGTFTPGQPLPLVLEPAVDNVDLAEWASNNRGFIEEKLLEHGALLYRGFNLATPSDFERVAASICDELFDEYGDLPRAGVAGKIYQSTPYPADKMILFHNESSHMHRWPRKINFFCVKASPEGGATPVVDCREVARRLDPKVLELFATKGLMYMRNFAEGLDVSWQQFFHTSDKAEVEKACAADGVTCEWTANNNLRIRQNCRAVVAHPKTGDPLFFNQVQLHHVFCLDKPTRDSLMSLFKEEDLPRHVYFGDGTPITAEIVQHVGEVYEQCAVRFQWRAGDMITLDNMRVAHARDPFVGERKIVVAMGDMMEASEASPASIAMAVAN